MLVSWDWLKEYVALDMTVIGSSVVTPGRGTHGLLLDRVQIVGDGGERDGSIMIENQDDGRNPGWSAANSVLWNCRASRLAIDSPPAAQNWVIDGEADETSGTAIYDTAGTARPESLYRAQLAERLGDNALSALDARPPMGQPAAGDR